jgi:hypothetical protein
MVWKVGKKGKPVPWNISTMEHQYYPMSTTYHPYSFHCHRPTPKPHESQYQPKDVNT